MPPTEVHVCSLFFLQATSGWHRVHESPAGQGERCPADCQGRLPHTCWDQKAQGAGEGQNDDTGNADHRFSRLTEDVWNMKAQYQGSWHWKIKVLHALTFCCININVYCFWFFITLLKWHFIKCLLLQPRFWTLSSYGRLCICVKGWVLRYVISSILKVCGVWHRLGLMLA